MSLLVLLCFACLSLAELREYRLEVRRTVWKPDGFPRSVLGFFAENSPEGTKPFPGPLIRARQNDTLRVIVRNMLSEELTSIHWHGLRQLKNPWQDGTPGITDGGILPHSTRTYEFQVRWYKKTRFVVEWDEKKKKKKGRPSRNVLVSLTQRRAILGWSSRSYCD